MINIEDPLRQMPGRKIQFVRGLIVLAGALFWGTFFGCISSVACIVFTMVHPVI